MASLVLSTQDVDLGKFFQGETSSRKLTLTYRGSSKALPSYHWSNTHSWGLVRLHPIDKNTYEVDIKVDSTGLSTARYTDDLVFDMARSTVTCHVTFRIEAEYRERPKTPVTPPPRRQTPQQTKLPIFLYLVIPVFLILLGFGMFEKIFNQPNRTTTTPSPQPTVVIVVPTLPPPTSTAIPVIVPTLYDTPTYVPTDPPIQVVFITATPFPTEIIYPTDLPPTSYPFYCQGALPSRVWVGATARVTTDNDLPNRVRNGPGLGYKQIGTLDPGTVFTITNGPKCNNQITWWEVNGNGWTAESQNDFYFIEPY